MIPDNSTLQPACEEVALASFIIGCLCHEGYIPLKLDNSDSRQDYTNAIRLTSAILAKMRAPDGDLAALPFQW